MSPPALLLAATDTRRLAGHLLQQLRLNPEAVLRLRTERDGTGPDGTAEGEPAAEAPGAGRRLGLWCRLPFGVLSRFEFRAVVPGLPASERLDEVLDAPQLLSGLPNPQGFQPGTTRVATLPVLRPSRWRATLPPDSLLVIERVPCTELTRLARAGEQAFHQARAQGLARSASGVRSLTSSVLDHVALRVTTAPEGVRAETLELPQAMVQALSWLGMLQGADLAVSHGPAWLGLSGVAGSVWSRRADGLSLGLA